MAKKKEDNKMVFLIIGAGLIIFLGYYLYTGGGAKPEITTPTAPTTPIAQTTTPTTTTPVTVTGADGETVSFGMEISAE